MYGAELGFSSNDEADEADIGGLLIAAAAAGATLNEAALNAGGVSPAGLLLDSQLPTILHSSPSASLHSAQTSNDDDSVKRPIDLQVRISNKTKKKQKQKNTPAPPPHTLQQTT